MKGGRRPQSPWNHQRFCNTKRAREIEKELKKYPPGTPFPDDFDERFPPAEAGWRKKAK